MKKFQWIVFSVLTVLLVTVAVEAAEYDSVKETVMVPMRDGTKLATDIYLPAKDGKAVPGKWPTLVKRNPYSNAWVAGGVQYLTKHGYAVVLQNVRGVYGSEGVFYPYRSEGFAEAKDGYDTIEWAAAQEWSNGKVGAFGISYLASNVWALVHNETRPPHLVAMAATQTASSYYGQGAFAGGAALWAHNLGYISRILALPYMAHEKDSHPNYDSDVAATNEIKEYLQELYWKLPIVPFQGLSEIKSDWLQWLDDWHSNETYNEYWAKQDHMPHYAKIDVPMLHIGGWYDYFNQGTVQNYIGVRKEGAGKAKDQTMLIMAPGGHVKLNKTAQGSQPGGAFTFPGNSVVDRKELYLAWFNHYLKGKPFTLGDGAANGALIYVPGLNKWVKASDFPLPQTKKVKYYLHSNGKANVSTLPYQGTLTTAKPTQNETPDTYVYDPANPVMSVGGFNGHNDGGVADRAKAYGGRDDILVFQTEKLKEDVAVVGPITVNLYASTSAKDTDFVVVLSDVDIPSAAGGFWISEGNRRGRIGDVEADPRAMQSYSKIELLEPGKIYKWQIAVWPTARVFKKGHRIRIDIASSNFPRYNRNLNTGEGITGTKMQTATQKIYHDRTHASYIELPVVPVDDLNAMVVKGPSE